jgi:NAD(P)-dependent dehydrogenase (short-subunit alcohol dehydrogenase family)
VKDLFGLEDRTIVVSGAGGGGIGTAVCEAVARVGADVIGVDIADNALDPSEKVVTEHGRRFTRILADTCDDTSVRSAVSQAEAAAGDLHGLVCIVGGAVLDDWKPLVGYEASDFERVLHFNLASAWQMSRAVAQSMIERGVAGSLVSLSSISASAASPFHAPYGAAKAALRQLAQTMAVEWGRYGIRVNVIAPGTIKTPRATIVDDPARDRQGIPLGRRGDASEIASASLFLLSDLASYVTGQTLAVDGGATTKLAHLDADGLPIFVSSVDELRKRFGVKEA